MFNHHPIILPRWQDVASFYSDAKMMIPLNQMNLHQYRLHLVDLLHLILHRIV